MSEEPHIPFDIDVVYEDAGIIVIDKPHFLATTPRGHVVSADRADPIA